jgi:two-component system response regulator DctR
MIYVVDDDAGVRQALVWLLRSRSLPCEPFDSAEAFVAELDRLRVPAPEPCALVLDVRMQGLSGLELFELLRQRELLERLPVIFLTGHADVPTAVRSVKNGALDFFEKPFNDNALVDRIVEALALSSRAAESAMSREEVVRRLGELTEREREVMRLIMQGRLNKVIADELGISMRTVEVHRSRIFTKLKVRSAVEMVNLLNRTGAGP